MGRGGPILWPARSPDLSIGLLALGLPEKQSVCICGDNIGGTKTGNH